MAVPKANMKDEKSRNNCGTKSCKGCRGRYENGITHTGMTAVAA